MVMNRLMIVVTTPIRHADNQAQPDRPATCYVPSLPARRAHPTAGGRRMPHEPRVPSSWHGPALGVWASAAMWQGRLTRHHLSRAPRSRLGRRERRARSAGFRRRRRTLGDQHAGRMTVASQREFAPVQAVLNERVVQGRMTKGQRARSCDATR